MQMNILSEEFKKKMARLSGVDLIKEEKENNLKLIKESEFLSEQDLLNEGLKDSALKLLTALTLLVGSQAAMAGGLKDELLKTNLKNKREVKAFEQNLQKQLKPEQVSSKEFINFKNNLINLSNEVGKTEKNKSEHSVTKYKDVVVKESNLSFNLTDPQSKQAFDQLIAKAKHGGSLVLSMDTLKQIVRINTPVEQVKLDQSIKISNQGFKTYNEYAANDSVVSSIANQIIKTFEGYESVDGYVEVIGSASHVPTTAFGGSNEKLAQARACAFSQQLSDKLPENLKDKIVVDYKVDGPEYEHDKDNVEKYAPYQFSNVNIHLAAVKAAPVVVQPSKVVVDIKVLSTSIEATKDVKKSIEISGHKKGNLKVSCPLNFRSKK